MSNQSKLGNLSQAEKSIGEKPAPDENNDNDDNNKEETAPDDKDSKEAKADMQSEGGKK